MALITCENVSIGYEGQTVVKELNFSIERGDYLCIVGENGSGKSTLVKSLLGLKGADRGKIIYGDGLKKNEIGYLPQKNEEQKGFPASVYEVVLSGRLNGRGWKPFYRKEEKEAAAELLLEAKGFPDVVVNLTGETADIVVPDTKVDDASRAQIEDIVKRKTGIAAENIVITPMSSQTEDGTQENQ